ncbi:MAG: hypothetical protein KatS3mg118_2403 [Paracoccaceae bacterium]|nr:MAG: hypothetical protein KatS3mg118_2403 [Paracoccaceae bacterium]
MNPVLARIAKLRWLPARHWYDLRQLMRLPARVRDPADGRLYRFHGDSFEAWQRGRSFLAKEPQTIGWLRGLAEGDVFLDIGANIGIFSLFAAHRVGEAGHVYAFEPHLPTAVQLLHNVALNGLGARITVLSIAASGRDGFAPFLYKRLREGASGSQLAIPGHPVMTRQEGAELKYGLTVDSMVAQGVIRPPTHVKIDTDGIELQITRGMAGLLGRPDRPRAILVEVQPGELDAQRDFMAGHGYRLAEAHTVGKWQRLRDRGTPLGQLAFNALFLPARGEDGEGAG